MPDTYDFANLSPIEFEGLCVDLVSAETDFRFERFAEGADGGMDGRHSRATGDIILQAKHYKGSTWSDLQAAARREAVKVAALNPTEYYFVTSQPLTAERKATLASILAHPSVIASRIWGRTELNALLQRHPLVEKRNIKLWLSSTAVLERLLNNDIAVFSAADDDQLKHILKVYVANPSLPASIKILEDRHCLIISGAPGIGKTTLSQVIAADHSDEGWELVAIGSIEEGFRAFRAEARQVFVFDDFLGKIQLDVAALANQQSKIVRFMTMVHKHKDKRFVLTTRAYIWEAALIFSEDLDDGRVRMSEMVLDLAMYTRELKARILYNHLYHSNIDPRSVQALLTGDTVRRIVDHRNYMPRIVEWMTDEIGQRGVPPDQYPAHFLSTLDRPDKIWEKAFRHHISEKARALLFAMYFCESEGWAETGVSSKALRPFFDLAMVCFGVVSEQGLRETMFEEALREVKSSFAVIEGDRANFINPSVQDFLSREAMDANVLRVIARSVPRWATAVRFWQLVKGSSSDHLKAEIAGLMLQRIIDNDLLGRMPLQELANLVGDLVLAADDIEFCHRLRRSNLQNAYWTIEGKLPSLVESLLDGRYSHLPHAQSFGRYLRREIYRYVSEDRDYAMELEELAELAESLSATNLQLPDAFAEHFDQAVEEAVDILSVDRIPEGHDPESEISEWLTHIEAIENYTPTAVSYTKKEEFTDRLQQLEWADEMRNRDNEDYSPGQRSASSGGPSGATHDFSNSDLAAMFSSLKNRD